MKKQIFLTLLALLSVFSARAYDFQVDGIYYDRISGTNEVAVTYKNSDYNCYSGAVVIPETVTYNGTTYRVTSIGYEAFRGCSGLTSVEIPNSVTYIGVMAFSGCSLTSVYYGGDIRQWCSRKWEIFVNGYDLYINNEKVVDLVIPNSVDTIEAYAFYGCTSLASVEIPESVTSIGYWAFGGCTGLTSITIPESVTSVGYRAFGGTGINHPIYNSHVFASLPEDYSGEYTIPDGIQLIAGDAFLGCKKLTSLTISNSVTSIEDGFLNSYWGWEYAAFDGCTALASVQWNARHCSSSSCLFSGSSLTSITFGDEVEYIPAGICKECSGLTSVTIPESVTSVESRAFWKCSNLTSVQWDARHCSSASSPFSGSSFTSITFGDKVEHIPAYLCSGCSGLTSVKIPESVTSVGYGAFRNTGIRTPLYNSKVFASLPEDYSGEYAIPSGIQSIAEGAFADCTGLTSVTIPNSVTVIGELAFYGCSGLTSVEIPNSVTSIGEGAFYGCSGLTSVEIPNSVTSIGVEAFYGCSGLTSVDIPNSVTSIGVEAFYGCSGLTSVEIPNSVTSIGEGAFYGCSALRSVTLPRSLEVISPYAFGDCDNLISVTCKATTPPRIGYYYDDDEDGEDEFIKGDEPVFSNYGGTLFVPYGCKTTYLLAPEWYNFSKIEELPSAGTATVTLRANDAAMGTVIGGGTYTLDEQVTLAAIPNQGYYFVRWDDGKTANPRILTVTEDITLTAIFAKTGSNPSDPGNPGGPGEPGGTTANEASLAAAAFAYVQGRTVYLSDGLGEVEAFTSTGQRVYRGFDRSFTLPHPGVYILRVVADGRRSKVIVR